MYYIGCIRFLPAECKYAYANVCVFVCVCGKYIHGTYSDNSGSAFAIGCTAPYGNLLEMLPYQQISITTTTTITNHTRTK